MDSPFDTSHQRAEQAPPKLRIVAGEESWQLLDEQLEILDRWVAAQKKTVLRTWPNTSRKSSLPQPREGR